MKTFYSLIALGLALGSILCAFCACAPNAEQPEETTVAETTDGGFEVDYSLFAPTGQQTMYIYCDADGDGICDDGANVFIRKEPTTQIPWVKELFRGTKVIRTGVYVSDENTGDGWSIIQYEGETFYVQNRYLSDYDPGPGKDLTIGN